MIHIIAIMLTGIAIGYYFRNLKIMQKTEKTISVTIITLLFILGLSIGSNQDIIDNLYSYSSQAAILAIFGLTGSIVASWLIFKIFFQRGGHL